MKKRVIGILISIFILISAFFFYFLYTFNYLPHRKYSNADFGIETYRSEVDKDKDTIDDQTDILNSAKEYVARKPKYKSKYYKNGYPDDEFGVCTDVVAFALFHAGYDIKELLNRDVIENKEIYNIPIRDANIDFRRVNNLAVYLSRHAISLTTDIKRKEEWQGGDIVVFKKHIGIISDHRNRKGIPFVIHHANSYQRFYEEDILSYYKDIVGHYRIS